MVETTTIGFDIAKQIFQVHGVSADNKVASWRAVLLALKPAAVHTTGPARSVLSAMTFD